MGKTIFIFSALLLFSALSAALIGSAAASEMDALGVLWDLKPRSRCEGLIGECFEEDEMQMDSEINRRFLAGRTYISYGALRANSVPCSKRGNSYYNCRSTSQANPYQRSCTQITRCARSTSWDSNTPHAAFLFLYISCSFSVNLISTDLLHSFLISDWIKASWNKKTKKLCMEFLGPRFESFRSTTKPLGASDAWNEMYSF